MGSHTPGPWAVDPNDSTTINAADGYRIADTAGVHLHVSHDNDRDGHWSSVPGAEREIPEDEEDANALLIAAAPEMLEALQRCEGELLYAAEKLPYSNAREALDVVRAAIATARGER